MLTVEAAGEELRRRCHAQWLNWALGRGSWPIRIHLGAPQGRTFDDDIIGAQVWAGAWRSQVNAGHLPGTLITAPRRARRLGSYELPTVWMIATSHEALMVALT